MDVLSQEGSFLKIELALNDSHRDASASRRFRPGGTSGADARGWQDETVIVDHPGGQWNIANVCQVTDLLQAMGKKRPQWLGGPVNAMRMRELAGS